MPKAGRVAALLLAIAGAVLPAAAQSLFEPPPLERYLRWGPLRVRPGFEVRNLGYDDNVFFRYDDDPRGASEGDLTITLGPKVDGVLLLGHRGFVTFRSRLDYTAYRRHSEINYFSTANDARITVPLKGIGLWAEAGYDRLRDRPIDAQDLRPVRREARAGGGVLLRFGWRTEAEIGLDRREFSNEDDDDPTIASRLDRVEDGARALLRYRAFGRTRVTAEGARREIAFDDPTVGANRNGDASRWLLGLEFGEGGGLEGSVKAGRARFDLARGPGTEFEGIVGEAALVYRPGRKTSIRLAALRDVVFSVYESSDLYEREDVTIHAVRWLNRAIGLDLRVRRGTLDFFLDPRGREDEITDLGGGVRFRLGETAIGRRVEYSLSYTRHRRDSTLDGFDSTRGVVGLGAIVGY